MKKALFLVAVMAINGGLLGCYAGPASHKIFVNQANYWVEKSILRLSRNSGPSLGVKPLPNGNMEEEWVRGDKCREFFEYDPKTNIIVSWRFVGSTSDCISIAP